MTSSSAPHAVTAARIFDGSQWHENAALIVAGGKVQQVVAADALPVGLATIEAKGSWIVPGFIDLQVNGGGGVLLNDAPTVEGIATICAAHAKFGTTALLPTLITDTFEVTARAVEAGISASQRQVPGFLGLHLEGPHLSIARKGAHDQQLIRPMQEEDIALLLSGREHFDAMIATIAPENATPDQARRLAQAGVTVSLGHTEASYDTARLYTEAGVSMVTHLFNAMSPLGHREPGLVGAALDIACLNAGLIADGIHVHPAAMSLAIRAKKGPGRIFIVTDAMSTIGTDLTSFTLNGREILRNSGKLTLADGTLAGADIDMISSVRNTHRTLGLPLEEALRMASWHAAEAIGLAERKGALQPGFDADFVVVTPDLSMVSTWIGGVAVHRQ